MPCADPIPAYRPATGGPLSFTRPITGQAGSDYHKLTIPCGYCILCRAEQARQQAVRIAHEATLHEENSFLTLTYTDEHLPPHNGLNYDDLVKFWKRLRQHFKRRELGKLRYYAVGEYGDRSLRPHYHACIFGHSFTQNRIITQTSPHMLWTDLELEQIWGLGQVRVGELNFKTARYTASYVTKQLRSKQRYAYTDEETGELIELPKPRAFMSKNLGKEWWLQNRHYVSANDQVIIEGRPQKPPKAYDRWLGEINELPLEMIKQHRTLRMVKQTQEQTRARARDAHARAKQKSKSI